MSAKLPPIALLTPVKVSVPTEPSPVAEPVPPAPMVIVTPEVALPILDLRVAVAGDGVVAGPDPGTR